MTKHPYKNIVITGASSGLGAALAVALSAPDVNLYICGRNAIRLQAVADHVSKAGGTPHQAIVDVANADEVQTWYDNIPLPDLVIANAGISGGTADGSEGLDQQHAIIDTNVKGVMNTLQPILDKIEERGSGQVAIIASLAGYKGFAGAPAYCASKAAVKIYGESLRDFYKHIGITTVCPGYVKTAMTDANDFTMPLMWSAEKAANHIIKKLPKNPARISFPRSLTFVVWTLMVLPAALTGWLMRRLPRKQAMAEKS